MRQSSHLGWAHCPRSPPGNKRMRTNKPLLRPKDAILYTYTLCLAQCSYLPFHTVPGRCQREGQRQAWSHRNGRICSQPILDPTSDCLFFLGYISWIPTFGLLISKTTNSYLAVLLEGLHMRMSEKATGTSLGANKARALKGAEGQSH